MANSEKQPGLIAVVMSVLAAMFGVQTEINRERDFAKGRPAAYIIVGVTMVTLFVLCIILIVNLVM